MNAGYSVLAKIFLLKITATSNCSNIRKFYIYITKNICQPKMKMSQKMFNISPG